MDLQEAICPKCGGPSPTGDICGKCRASDIEWFTCDGRVRLVRCPNCNSMRDNNGWNDCERSREDLEYEAAISAIHLFQDIQKPEISIKLEENSKNRTFAHISITGLLYNEPREGACTVEILWQFDSCDRCSRYHGNYWQGVVQLRADGRKATPEEQERAKRIAYQAEEELQLQGDRLSFVTRMEEGREGLDIIVGTQTLGEKISRDITRRMGGKFSLHPTLVGEKEGKKLFRITYAVRLPRYTKGDIIFIRNTYGEILGAEGKTISYLDLASGIPRTVPESTQSRYIGSVRDGIPMLVIYQDGETLGLMNEETGKTEEVPVQSWRNIVSGERVHIIRDDDRVLVV
ncbi:60S ribosomal export protein NMD3 [Methanospirillum hungatei]|uniref:60S ribosomal export protein NMD3 n=2 Tax=Methanospirillum hungatei TaxID=2203 RepID=UPI001B694BAB|nr:60S ribosomal export protein NMD3 [Methanospirillum hungatei]MBP9007777.1 60S ribosomal export protein NMD3 [Methanospirillum sp.]HOW04870.1 60S ribosomal export protein NMD3 [Methanospirillum hungatei]